MRLAAHGTLHLVGYDDATEAERKQMSRLEDYYIQQHFSHAKDF
jgi:ssRNA-specific RNase YbeY (16S rRNA maturation enzyme)